MRQLPLIGYHQFHATKESQRARIKLTAAAHHQWQRICLQVALYWNFMWIVQFGV